jgi:hypothetical protein
LSGWAPLWPAFRPSAGKNDCTMRVPSNDEIESSRS